MTRKEEVSLVLLLFSRKKNIYYRYNFITGKRSLLLGQSALLPTSRLADLIDLQSGHNGHGRHLQSGIAASADLQVALLSLPLFVGL